MINRFKKLFFKKNDKNYELTNIQTRGNNNKNIDFNYLIENISNTILGYKYHSVNELICSFELNDVKSKNIKSILINKIFEKNNIQNLINALENYGVLIKTISLNEKNKIKEHIPLSKIDISDMDVNTKFIDTSFYNNVLKKMFLFVIFKENEFGDSYILDVLLFNFDSWMFDHAEDVYNKTKKLFNNGRIINDDKSLNFVKYSDNITFHIRPKAKDGKDTYKTQFGEIITKQAFWLNNIVIIEKLKLLKRDYVLNSFINGENENYCKDSTLIENQNVDISKSNLLNNNLNLEIKINSIYWNNSDFIEIIKKYNIYNLNDMYIVDDIRDSIVKWIIERIRNNNCFISKEELYSLNDENILSKSNFDKIIIFIINKLILLKIGNFFYLEKPNIYEYIKKTDNEKTNIIKYIIQGEDSEIIKKILSINNQEIDEQKNIIYNLSLWEDYFSSLFKKYNFNIESIKKILNLDILSFLYLNWKYKKGNLNIDLIFKDNDVPNWIIENLDKYISKKYFFINGNKILKDKDEIFYYVLNNFFESNKYFSFNNYYYVYDYFFAKNNINDDLKYNKSSINMKLYEDDNFITKDESFKKIEISNFDLNVFLKEIDFYKLDNIEISTNYFFDRFRDVLKKYFINDEYELYIFLKKKISNIIDNDNIQFFNKHNIRFGNARREEQVIELVKKLSPISKEDFLMEYRKLYGTKESVILSENYLNIISEYLDYDNFYKVNDFSFLSFKFNNFKKHFTKEFYEYKEFVQILESINIDCDWEKTEINNVIKNLNFKISNNLIYSNKYNSVDSFFRNFIKEFDIIDFNSEYNFLYENNLCRTSLNFLCKEYDFIEFLDKQYISINRLFKKSGITKNDINQFVDDCLFFCEKKYFTLYYLKLIGFNHSLFDLGFDDLFYINILKNNDKIRFLKINKKILMKEKTSKILISDFILEYFKNVLSINIYELVENIKIKYDIYFEKSRIIENICDTSLYYDKIFEKIFVNYNQYLEEI